MLIIDTHAHIYSPDEKRYPPIDKPLRPPGGKGSLEDLQQESRANGVKAVCAIQTSTFYRFDNRYICDSARAHPYLDCGCVHARSGRRAQSRLAAAICS
jgi:predicted TIM-barrel fold metal-dependent hydrolase